MGGSKPSAGLFSEGKHVSAQALPSMEWWGLVLSPAEGMQQVPEHWVGAAHTGMCWGKLGWQQPHLWECPGCRSWLAWGWLCLLMPCQLCPVCCAAAGRLL